MALIRNSVCTAIAVVILSACGGDAAPTADSVIEKLQATGVQINDVTKPPRDGNAIMPQSYQEHVVFSIPTVAPKGGQFFICDTKKNCDAIYSYYDALKALAGPYIYQSKSGLVVMQLNSGLTPADAAKLEAAVQGL